MNGQTLLQKGARGADLFLQVPIDGEITGPPGLSGWIRCIAGRRGLDGFHKTCVTTWRAGAQVIKEICRGSEWPDAIVSLDGLYGMKPAGAKPGDGRVVWDTDMEAVAGYALAAAREERVMVLVHSRVAAPHASSREAAQAIQRWVERKIGWPMRGDLSVSLADLNGRRIAKTLVLGNLYIVELAGATAVEDVAEVHPYDAVFRRWVPWTCQSRGDWQIDEALPDASVGPGTSRCAAMVRRWLRRAEQASDARGVGRAGAPRDGDP